MKLEGLVKQKLQRVENGGYEHLSYPVMFQKDRFSRVFKVRDWLEKTV